MQDLKIERNDESSHVDRCFVNGNAGANRFQAPLQQRRSATIPIRNGGLYSTMDGFGAGSSQDSQTNPSFALKLPPRLTMPIFDNRDRTSTSGWNAAD